jgi:hypothetical protein
LHLGEREQHDLPSAEHDGVRRGEGPAGMVRGLAQVRGSGSGLQVWPQGVHGPLARQAVPLGQSEQLHQLRRPACRPSFLCHLPSVPQHPETAEQLDPYVLDLSRPVHGLPPSSVQRRSVGEIRALSPRMGPWPAAAQVPARRNGHRAAQRRTVRVMPEPPVPRWRMIGPALTSPACTSLKMARFLPPRCTRAVLRQYGE